MIKDNIRFLKAFSWTTHTQDCKSHEGIVIYAIQRTKTGFALTTEAENLSQAPKICRTQ